MEIRPADGADHAGIDALLKAAFPGPGEARLVTALRAAEADTIELVAAADGGIVGEVMFSPVTAIGETGTQRHGIGLGPVAVDASRRERGIGAALVETGLDFLRPLGVPWCVVLGEPDYYRRFGFVPAPEMGWRWSGDPDDRYGPAFQVLGLQPGADLSGPAVLRYHPAFETV